MIRILQYPVSVPSAGMESACHDKSRTQKKWTDTAIRRFDEGSTWCLTDVLRDHVQQVQYLNCTGQGGAGCPRTHTHEHTGIGPLWPNGNVIILSYPCHEGS